MRVVIAILIGSCILGLANPAVSLFASESEPAELAPSVSSLQIGLSGTITSNILLARLTDNGEKAIFVGTSEGLYIIVNGALGRFIFFSSPVTNIALIDDITGDGIRDIVVSLKDTYIANIRCYDGATGEEIWYFTTTQEAFVEDVGWAEVQGLPFDLNVVEDVNSDGFEDVAITSGRCLYLLDGKTGGLIWKFEADDELRQIASLSDMNGDGIGELAIGAQDGFMYVISGREGKLWWQKRIAEEATTEWGEVLEYSVGDILPLDIDTKEKVVVSTEDGKVRLIDLHDVIYDWEAIIAEADTSPKLHISLVADVTADGIKEVLVSNQTESEVDIILIDTATTEVIWRKTLSLGGKTHLEMTSLNGKQVILVPQGKSGSGEKVAVIDVENGELIESLEIMSVSESFSDRSDERWVKGFDENSFLFVSNQGDLLCVSSQAEVLWHYPRVSEVAVEEGRFTSDETPDLLICSKHDQPGRQGFTARILYVIDGATYQEVWRYEVPYEEFIASGGISGIKIVPDLNQDGAQDIIGYKGSEIVVFSGRDGADLPPVSLAKGISSLDIIQNGENGIAFIVGTVNDISIIDLEGELLWSKPYADRDGGVTTGQADFRVLDDINGDGISDLAIFLARKLIIVVSAAEGDTLDFTPSLTIEADEEETIEPGNVISDIDGDDIGEITFIKKHVGEKEQSSFLVILSPPTGETLLELEQEGELILDLACADFNDDGYADSIICWKWREGPGPVFEKDGIPIPIGPRGGAELGIISGKDGESIWKFSFSTPIGEDIIPATPISDINGDGIADLALVRASQYGELQIAIYDVAHNSLLKEISVVPSRREPYMLPPTKAPYEMPEWWSPGGFIQELGDFNGDGNKEVAIFQSAYKQGDEEERFMPPSAMEREAVEQKLKMAGTVGSAEKKHPVIVDILNEQVMARFLILGSEFIEIGEEGKLGMVGGSGGFYLLNMANNLHLTSPTEGSTQTSPLKIGWEGTSPGDFNLIFIDGVQNGLTYKEEITLPVARGEHELTIYSLDEYGRVAQATVNFKVESQLWALILACIALLLLVSSIFSLRLMRTITRHRRRTGHG